MDGAHAQLKLLTNEESLKRESELKITVNKHSATRTGVEQAADCGPNFKLMKRLLKSLSTPHQESNPIALQLNNIFNELESDSNENTNILRLKAHKKKSLLSTLPVLPIATCVAYTADNVKTGFIYNGQIDETNNSVPCF